MDCEEIIKLISEYMDGAVTGSERDDFEEHLSLCEDCFCLLATLEKTLLFSREISRRKKVPRQVISRVYYEIRVRYKK